MNNPLGAQEIPLTVFGGVNLELSPTDLPMGLSPDAKDVAFLPGSVFTRPPLVADGTSVNSAILYVTSFTKPDGTVVELKFDVLGRMFANGVQIGQTAAGNRFQAISAFGRCYLATSDGLHGADVPLQFDGTNLDRISQDGPGDAPSFAATAITGDTYPIATITQPAAQGGHAPWGFSYFLQSTGPGSSTAGTTATVYYADSTLSGPDMDLVNAFNSGFPVYVYTSFTGVPVVQGPYTVRVTSVGIAQPPGQPRSFYYFTYELPNSSYTYYAGSGHAGYTANYQRTLATLTTGVPVPGLEVGGIAVVSGASVTAYDGNQTITQTPSSAALQITQTSRTAGVATYHYSVITGTPPTAGQLVTITGTLNANGSLNGSNLTIASASGGTSGTFDIAIPGADFGTASEAGQGETAGTVFAFDPGIAAVGTTIDPIYGSSTGGTLTFGGSAAVVAPGTRKGVLIFQTRTGYLTIPSKVVTFTVPENTNAIAVSNIPLGPPNVIARIMAFTGANGGKFFYLPVPPQTNNVVSGTSTVVNDNTTTSAVVQFSDASLLSGTAIDIPGNNLFRQVVLGPILGVFAYAGRLGAWGERNKIQQFWNMGFEGGYYSSTPTFPLGWTKLDGAGSLVSRGNYGQAWQVVGSGDGLDGLLSQPAFQDQNDIAILTPQTKYRYRLWAQGSGTATAEFYSQSAGGVIAIASAPIPSGGGFIEAVFSNATPVTIPADTELRTYVSGLAAGQIAVTDELEIIYDQNPFLTYSRWSYVDNFEAFDGVTGNLGPASDPNAVMAFQQRRDLLNLLTFGPNGSLYETEDTASGEPATWNVRHVSAQCGIISLWGMANFEDWFCWTSDTGLRIYDGGNVDKMSQEVQPLWDSFNPSAKQYTVLASDPYERRIYLLCSTGEATSPNETWVLDYRELNTAGALANSGTLRISNTGHVVTTDLTRKWVPWSMVMNYCGLIAEQNGGAAMKFCGQNLYTLNEGSLAGIDADYGAFWQDSYYTPFFFIPQEDAQQRQVGVHRLLHTFLTANVTGIGKVYFTPHIDRIGNTGTSTRAVAVTEDLARDLEFGLNLAGERISYQLRCQPSGVAPYDPAAQAGFRLSSMCVAVKTHPFSPIRGWNG